MVCARFGIHYGVRGFFSCFSEALRVRKSDETPSKLMVIFGESGSRGISANQQQQQLAVEGNENGMKRSRIGLELCCGCLLPNARQSVPRDIAACGKGWK